MLCCSCSCPIMCVWEGDAVFVGERGTSVRLHTVPAFCPVAPTPLPAQASRSVIPRP